MAQGHSTAAAIASFIGVQRCCLPGLKTLQILQTSAQLRRQKVPQQAQQAPRPQAKATTRPQQWLKGKGTPRPQQWLLIGVQGCRLPGLKCSKPSKSPPNSAGQRYLNKPNRRHARTQKPPQGYSNGSRALHGRSNSFFYRRSTLLFARPQTLQTLQKSAQLRREKVPQQTSPTRATPAGKSHHKATAMAQGHPTAAAMASYRRLRLPFARPQTLQIAPKVRPAPQAKRTPTSSTRATPAGKSHHKATAMAEGQGHPPAAAMAIRASYRRSRLPFARPLQRSAQLRKEKVPQQAQHAPLPHAGCNFSLLEKQTAICLSCCPSPSLSLQYPPSN